MSDCNGWPTISDENRIVDRLMCEGYKIQEIEAAFALQAKTDRDFTTDSVRKHIWKSAYRMKSVQDTLKSNG